MPNYRYVAQGEFYVTTNPDTVLVTSRMIDCIAIAFIDRKNPDNRMLSHLDGQILANQQNAVQNLRLMEKAFKAKTLAQAYEVYLLGGQKTFHNYRILLLALEELGIHITRSVDINEFCDLLNLCKADYEKCTKLEADATLICNPSLPPDFVSYNNYYFTPPLSEDELICGKGIASYEEQEEYQHFSAINEKILTDDSALAQKVRTSADKRWLRLAN